ncbi:MAG: N5-glutamine methyltransferase family protein, partial [Bacillota bacterium]
IPRPETELLIDRALPWLNKLKSEGSEMIRVVDLGTGSGAIAITIALKIPGVNIDAVDISERALEVAKSNATMHQVKDKINWHCGDYFDVFEKFTIQPLFNLIISNPPYLSKNDIEELPPHIIEHEPREALYGGVDGIESYRQIFKNLSRYMGEPFLLLLEAGSSQKSLLESLCRKSGLFKSITWHDDLAGYSRVLEAER